VVLVVPVVEPAEVAALMDAAGREDAAEARRMQRLERML